VTCMECSCTPTFIGCFGPNEGQPMCPALNCPQPQCCHTETDCPGDVSISMCAVPPFDPSCGPCDPYICAPQPCACSTSYACQPGCSNDGDCKENETCGSDHRCKPRPCDSKCNGNYACDAAQAICIRRACSSDSDCGKPGYCVDRACSKSLGQCQMITF
jgi:hypothetical protein